MAKKMKKAVKKLGESVAELQEQNERILRELEQVRGILDRQGDDDSPTEEAAGDHYGAPEQEHQREETSGSRDEEEQESAEPEATEAAGRKASELDVELDQVEGTGSGGRITVKDVEAMA